MEIFDYCSKLNKRQTFGVLAETKGSSSEMSASSTRDDQNF